jgi:transmembrane sensor
MNSIVRRKADLIVRYLQNTLTETEQEELENWASASEDNRQLFARLTDLDQLNNTLTKYAEKKKKIYYKIEAAIAVDKARRSRLWSRWWKYIAAIALLIMFLTIAYYWLGARTPKASVENLPVLYKNDMPKQARLTLDDGSVIVLVDTINGVLAKDGSGSTQVFKENGWLSYQGGEPGDSLYFNTIHIPRGEQYKLILPDGSRVWLNSGSSLRYPVVFSGTRRRVELTGEAYFEVTSFPKMASLDPQNNIATDNIPFVVNMQMPFNGEVEALGARFNVMAYGDDSSSHTTLLEGRAKLRKGKKELIMEPGQKGLLGRSDKLTLISDIIINKAYRALPATIDLVKP